MLDCDTGAEHFLWHTLSAVSVASMWDAISAYVVYGHIFPAATFIFCEVHFGVSPVIYILY